MDTHGSQQKQRERGAARKMRPNLIQRWYALTSLPDASAESTFLRREAVRRSRLASSVITIFALLVLSLVVVTFFVRDIYPWYFWLSLELFFMCFIALLVNRRGLTYTAGFIVTTSSFLTLTLALFSTIPFDETTLQGYDMFVLLLLLAVFLLPPKSVFLYLFLCCGVIIGTLLKMPLSPVLRTDLSERLILVLARPIGILFMTALVIYIIATQLTKAIGRANEAEAIVKLEREQAAFRENMEDGIKQILETHVQISNGNLSARAPLSDNNVLWQIAQALNRLLIRFQRAMQAERTLQHLEHAMNNTVQVIQEADHKKEKPCILPPTHTSLDKVIAALQGISIGYTPPSTTKHSTADFMTKY